ncbi:tyramine receptor Ser-2-like [Babylonia areolata]|uniref:tyramine receptor Ser-2-like n=1 Tax=Babylonia areolata TaxID=304850 RepID=UPI003FD273F7
MDLTTRDSSINVTTGDTSSPLQQQQQQGRNPSMDPVDLETPELAFSLLPLPALLLLTPLMLSFIAISVGSNVLVLLSYKPHMLFVDAQSLYLLHLAVSDLLISVFCMPLHLISTLWSSGWPLGRVMCQLYTAVQLTLLNVTTLVLVLVALDGLLQAEEGMRSTGLEAKRKAYLWLALCWLLALAVRLPETLSWDMFQGHSLECRPHFYVGHVLFVQVWSFFLPVLILSVINTRLYFRLRSLSLTILTFGHTFPSRPVSGYDITGEGRKNLERQERIAISDTNIAAGEEFHDISVIALRHPGESPRQKHAARQGVSRMIYIDRSPQKGRSFSPGRMSVRSFSTGQIGKMTSQAGRRSDRTRCGSRRSQSSNDLKDIRLPDTRVDNKHAPERVQVSRRSDTSSVMDDGESSGAKAGGCLTSRSRHVSLETPYRLKRVAVILFTLVLILVVCWLPYSVASLVRSMCPDCVHPVVYSVLLWVLYFKSCINPFLYAYNTFAFRNRFRRLLVRVFPVKRLRRMTTDLVSNERASILN